MGFSIAGIALGVILLILQLFIGGLWVTGFPVSDRMDDHDTDTEYFRSADYARYYYVMGLLLIIICVVSLVIAVIPFAIVKKIGCVLVIIFSLVWLFIVTQVHALSIDNLIYPDCSEASSGHETDVCSGDKINFVATLLLAIINSMQVAYAVAFFHDSGEEK